MSRYNRTRISVNDGENPKHYKTAIYQEIPESNDDIYVITQEGDRLDTIAQQFYGNPHLWWFIARTNKINEMNVEVGRRLRISFDLQKAGVKLDKSKS